MFRTMALATLLFVVITLPLFALDVRNDRGGSVKDRVALIEQLRAAGTTVRILGRCDSSCTMFLKIACVAPRARLGFHGPQSQYYGISLTPEDFLYWSEVMANYYPAKIKSWFLREARHETLGLTIITGATAIKLGAKPCN
jgi:hypothetical protein